MDGDLLRDGVARGVDRGVEHPEVISPVGLES